MARRETSHIERLTPDDAVALATDVGAVPMHVGAVLVLDRRVEHGELCARLQERLPAVPRLRQRLQPTPVLGGRWLWVDDDRFDLANHLAVDAPEASDQDELLRTAVDVICRPMDRTRPLWRAELVQLHDDRSAVVVAFHHVLSDGIGGLAVLASLVDATAGPPPADPEFPRPGPTGRDLVRHATRARLEPLRYPARSGRRLVDALAQLRPSAGGRPRRSSLNTATGAERALLSVRVPLEPLHAAAKRRGATVNDALLAAVGGALGALLADRGEHLEELVISMPMSARTETSGTALGNRVGAVPVRVPVAGHLTDRLGEVARRTQRARATVRGSSAAVLGPVFRLLARTGLFGWFVDHQRLVHTFVTNLRGPDEPLTFLGATITEVHPVAMITGNVTVSFAALSYAGTMRVTIIVDPVACPDADALRQHLQSQLDDLCALAERTEPSRGP